MSLDNPFDKQGFIPQEEDVAAQERQNDVTEERPVETVERIQSEDRQKALEDALRSLSYGYLDNAMEIAAPFSLKDSIVADPGFERAWRLAASKFLTYKQPELIKAMADLFPIPAEEIELIVRKELLKQVATGNDLFAIPLAEAFPPGEDFKQSPEFLDAARSGLLRCAARGSLDPFINLRKEFGIPANVADSPEVSEAMDGHLRLLLSRNSFYEALKFLDEFTVSESVLAAPEVRQTAKEYLLDQITRGTIDQANRIKKNFALPEEVVRSDDVQSAAYIRAAVELAIGRLRSGISVIESSYLGQEAVFDARIRANASEGLNLNMCRYDVGSKEYLQRVIEFFGLSHDLVDDAVRRSAVNMISDGRLRSLEYMLKDYPQPESVMNGPVMREAALKGIAGLASHGRTEDAEKIASMVSMEPEMLRGTEIQEAAKAGLQIFARQGTGYTCKQIIQTFGLNDETIRLPEIQEAAKAGLRYLVYRGLIDSALDLIEILSLPEDVIASFEVQSVMRTTLENLRNEQKDDDARKLETIMRQQ